MGTGGHRPAVLKPHRDFLAAALAEQPDITLDALSRRLAAARSVRADTSMLSRFFRRERITFKKKTLVASERDRPDVSRRREQWRKYQGRIAPSRLVFIDETWGKTNLTRSHGWAPRGHRLLAKVPHGQWETTTFLAALRHDLIDAPCLFDGPINGERFLAYVRQMLVPTLKPGDVVILDNLGSHKGKAVRQAVRAVGAKRIPCPSTRPISIRSSRPSQSSKHTCARRPLDPPRMSASPSASSSKASNPKNAPTTSGTQDMPQPKSRTL